MAPFRGSDDVLNEEIATLEAIAKLRLRRYARELNDIERDLRELKSERVRRKALNRVGPVIQTSVEPVYQADDPNSS